MIASVFLLASWLGCMLMASFGMILGRRQNIIIGNAISAIGSIISASSQSAGQMIASRVIIVSYAGDFRRHYLTRIRV
jgi:MFS family permease